MARLIPSDFESADQAGELHRAEAATLSRLKDGLNDRYTIYHGVHWARANQAGSVYGEIDFIISNRFGRLLAIEQKNSKIISDGNDLYARYNSGSTQESDTKRNSDKSVTTQVNRNLNALRAQFSRRYPGRSLNIDHLLYLPTTKLLGQLPSSVDPLRVVDADHADHLIEIIENLLPDTESDVSSDRIDNLSYIEDFLSQRVDAVPHIGLLGKSAREVTTRLSGGLSTWASRLYMTPWRLRVQGTAGSGKTQLALHLLRQAHASEKSAIYVCFNRPLADAMKLLTPDPSSVVTFHELARVATSQAGRPNPDFSQPGIFESLAEEFIELSVQFSNTFDVVVIDEGQDFEPNWANSLISMAKTDAQILWLEDSDQGLYDRQPAEMPNWVCLTSPVNYRSPQLLVDFINWLELTTEPVESGSSVVGFDPIWHVYSNDESAVHVTEDAIASLLKEGYHPSNIAVLSFRGLGSSNIASKNGPRKLAGVNVKKQMGYDPQGNAIWSEGEILVDSVFRFKGQAADAVIITEIDFSEFSQHAKKRLFVALTRARLQAVLITSDRSAQQLQHLLSA